MIKESYVSFETAKLLNEKGFDEETEHEMWYVVEQFSTGCPWNSYTYKVGSITREYDDDCCITMPTQQMAMQWLREVHNMHIMVNCVGKVNYDPIIQCFDGKDFEIEGYEVGTTRTINGKCVNVRRGFRTYEEAVEAAIKYCLTELI